MKSPARVSSSTRAAQKQAARLRDDRDRASGLKSVARLRRENEVFAGLAGRGCVNLHASRALG